MGITRGPIIVDFREYIFDGTIKWPMNYGGSAEKWTAGKDRSHVARAVHHCGEIYYSAERD